MHEVLGGWLLGMALGMRHALEPDHIAAVSTLMADRPRVRTAAWIGASWGLGHSLALCLAGGALLALRAEMPPQLADAFELVVAAMLVFLGVRALVRAFSEGRAGAAARAPHAHGAGRPRHEHDGPAAHLHLGRFTLARRPLVVGLVHGLAGSGALATLAVTAMPSRGAALAYMALFSAGSIAGMALVTGASAWSLARVLSPVRTRARLLAFAGCVSLVVGVAWAVPLIGRLAT
jgi:high-affinity nickel-transport protein